MLLQELKNVENKLRELKESNFVEYKAGELIFRFENAQRLSVDWEERKAVFKVVDYVFDKPLVVVLNDFGSPKITFTCSCDTGPKVPCSHIVASLLALKTALEKGEGPSKVKMDENETQEFLNKEVATSSEPTESAKKEDSFEIYDTKNFLHDFFGDAKPDFRKQKNSKDILRSNILDNTGRKVKAMVYETRRFHGETVTFSYSPNNDTYSMSCTCGSGQFCRHKKSLLHRLLDWDDSDPFHKFREPARKAGMRLQEYGFDINNDEWKPFFSVDLERTGIVRPNDPGMMKRAEYINWDNIVRDAIPWQDTEDVLKTMGKISQPEYGLGVLWRKDKYPHLSPLRGKIKKNGTLGTPFRECAEEEIFSLADRLGKRELFVGIWNMDESEYAAATGRNPGAFPDPEFGTLMLDSLRKLRSEMLDTEHFFLNGKIGESPSLQNMDKVILAPRAPELVFHLSKNEEGKRISFSASLLLRDNLIPYNAENMLLSYGVVKHEDTLYLLDSKDAKILTKLFNSIETYNLDARDEGVFVQQFVLPLIEHFHVEMTGIDVPMERIQAAPPQGRIALKEIGEHLVVQPVFNYQLADDWQHEVEMDGGGVFRSLRGDFTYVVERNIEAEGDFRRFVESLHPDFPNQAYGMFFSLSFDKVLQNDWFFGFFQELKEKNIEVLGFKELKKFRYNPNRPNVRLSASSGIDWFGVKMDVEFGGQMVKLADIRKAVLNGQQYVRLGDGTIGILPEEWLERYSGMLKLGKVKDNDLRLSSTQIGLLDNIEEDLAGEEAFAELAEKRARLREFESIKDVAIPHNVKADLRDYQKAGYNWLNFLDDFGWGGCLADDMGLGKTLQVLAFLQNIQNRAEEDEARQTHLIVVPRSLVFNWVREIEKFCPDLTYLDHSDTLRARNAKTFDNYDLVITTYRIVISDIDFLRRFRFGYVVLDESQAVKNPLTQSSKAVRTLTADNRLIMTGTPIENNTFDLFAQFDFLNPGMLGSLDFFRREYANRIDKDKDIRAVNELRKLVYPFILNRKKNQVLKELPEKTEIVEYCEMSPDQRRVYDYYKDLYRNKIKEEIALSGMQGANIHILEGLLKLRQVCDSPALVSQEGQVYTDQSIKMEALFEKIKPIAEEGHKALVFSFFTSMLDLVKARLEEEGIGYSYLSGSTQNRERVVDSFKADVNKKVFLISLKAGGFGLNLTEASYVFLIDPWWNPAAEQQAIDRAHRIGQEQSVFAYKLICRDTVEEKILELQEKKKSLASDVIHTESSFLKQLKPSDIDSLFG
ncbi:hypothetical protein FUAX_47810 (plasmid) [Fulvitalea axinellae]|uniref:Uncharacterized protein n=1 Tax=Fulvitalea axinellae TaxID=1182444 RepID=A0AAU9DCZ9_9BACT|nr:hypothetical protein FUAX_47810 [Fulvitalea axinellae]